MVTTDAQGCSFKQPSLKFLEFFDIYHLTGKLPLTPDALKRLHALCQGASVDAGQFKRADNEVVELRPGAAPVIRFKCVSAKQTPAAVDELCWLYRRNGWEVRLAILHPQSSILDIRGLARS